MTLVNPSMIPQKTSRLRGTRATLTIVGLVARQSTEVARTGTTPNPISTEASTAPSENAYWYGAIPNMRDDWLQNLMKAFDEIVSEHATFGEVYALI